MLRTGLQQQNECSRVAQLASNILFGQARGLRAIPDSWRSLANTPFCTIMKACLWEDGNWFGHAPMQIKQLLNALKTLLSEQRSEVSFSQLKVQNIWVWINVSLLRLLQAFIVLVTYQKFLIWYDAGSKMGACNSCIIFHNCIEAVLICSQHTPNTDSVIPCCL